MAPGTGVRLALVPLGAALSGVAVTTLLSMEIVPENHVATLYAMGQFAVLVVGLLLIREGLDRRDRPARRVSPRLIRHDSGGQARPLRFPLRGPPRETRAARKAPRAAAPRP